MMLLIIHLVLGYRRLKDIRYYADDSLVQRALGLTTLPDAATISRHLASMDEHSVENLRGYNRDQVLQRCIFRPIVNTHSGLS